MKLDERYITTIQNRDFVKYDGLLDIAHQKGLQRIEIQSLQLPSPENDYTAVCLASITTTGGETFVDIGDANPNNVTHKIAPHIIRMASTRAKARALRDLCNTGMTCVEELGDVNDIVNDEQAKAFSSAKRNGDAKSNGHRNGNNANSFRPMSRAQRNAILNLAHRKRIPEEELYQKIEEHYNSTFDQLSIQDASQLIQSLQNGKENV